MNKNGGEGLMSTLLFKHVNVVDVRNQQILSDVDVWIKNERIEKIEGKVSFRYWPLNKFGKID